RAGFVEGLYGRCRRTAAGASQVALRADWSLGTLRLRANAVWRLSVFCPNCGTWNRAASAVCTRCEATLPELERAPFERPDEELSRLRRAAGNRYRVLRRLGGGGMADVYLAEHVQLSRQVVLKVLHPHLGRDAEVAERF